MERRALQAVLGVLSVLPLIGLGLTWVVGPVYFLHGAPGEVGVSLDNQMRYLAGIYAGAVTGALWWAIPAVEERGIAVRLAAGAVFLGGVGRCVSMLSVGPPSDATMLYGLALEMGVTPLLVLWQRRVARTAARGAPSVARPD